MQVAAWLWYLLAAVAAVMGLLLLVSGEPAATAGRSYLGLMVIGGALGVLAFRAASSPRQSRAVVATASVVATLLVGVQAFVISDFAYQGLSTILLVMALLAALAGVIAWWRER